MGVGDALDLYDRVKEYEEAERIAKQTAARQPIYMVIWAVILLIVIFFIIRSIIKHNKAKNAAKIAKTVVSVNPIPTPSQQSMGMSQRIVDPNQYGLVAVGILKVKSIVQAASYREIVCSFHNNDINLDFNLTDVGEYKWLNEGDEIKVHLAKDQFKYYISKCDM
ncbi:MAG: hypothetical protein ACI4R5_00825 [Acetatifactor sp.]